MLNVTLLSRIFSGLQFIVQIHGVVFCCSFFFNSQHTFHWFLPWLLHAFTGFTSVQSQKARMNGKSEWEEKNGETRQRKKVDKDGTKNLQKWIRNLFNVHAMCTCTAHTTEYKHNNYVIIYATETHSTYVIVIYVYST